jgi:AcrR family transcriptional regulator
VTRPFYIPDDTPAGKAAILEAALDLFAQRGLNGTTIRDIADKAGVTNPALYKHFKSKEEVAVHLFVVCYRRLVERVQRALDSAATPTDKAHAYIDAYVQAFDECEQAPIYVNDHLRELWPVASAQLAGPNMVTQTEELVRALRGSRQTRLDDKIIAAAILGALAQCARFAFFGELARPASRWKKQLVLLLLNLVEE